MAYKNIFPKIFPLEGAVYRILVCRALQELNTSYNNLRQRIKLISLIFYTTQVTEPWDKAHLVNSISIFLEVISSIHFITIVWRRPLEITLNYVRNL